MPVGGTAIARALEAGRELLERDPKSKQHRRVMLLVTDGEDLEGDPVAVAQSLQASRYHHRRGANRRTHAGADPGRERSR